MNNCSILRKFRRATTIFAIFSLCLMNKSGPCMNVAELYSPGISHQYILQLSESRPYLARHSELWVESFVKLQREHLHTDIASTADGSTTLTRRVLFPETSSATCDAEVTPNDTAIDNTNRECNNGTGLSCAILAVLPFDRVLDGRKRTKALIETRISQDE